MAYIQQDHPSPGCIFCDALQKPNGVDNLIVARGERAFVILNRYPYTSGHLMVVPNAHRPDLLQLDAETRAELIELVTRCIDVLQTEYHPQGFNVGANLGGAAGAGIPGHVHFHIVPRWNGDTSYMTTVGQARILPEALEDTYRRICAAWYT